MDYKFAHAFSTDIFGNHLNQCIPTRAFQRCAAHATDPKIYRNKSKMAIHPIGVSIDILGIKQGNQGHSCKGHDIFGSVLSTDVVICLQKV